MAVSMFGQPSPSILTVTEQDARSHLVSDAPPTYPPIAKAAHVEGDVRLSISIGADGHVISVEALDGPPMLRGAAIDAVKTWTFSPFAKAQKVATKVTVSFKIPSTGPTPTKAQIEAAQAYFPLAEKCRAALRLPDVQAAADGCKRTLDIAVAAGDLTNSDQLALMDAHELYGHALLRAGKLQLALSEEDAAIEESRKCLTDVDQEYAMPFYWRSVAEAAMGQSDHALADITIAEDTHRKAMKNLPDMKAVYGRYFATILRQHAAWLDQLGRSEEASKLRNEASSL
jgi:TonB family protein